PSEREPRRNRRSIGNLLWNGSDSKCRSADRRCSHRRAGRCPRSHLRSLPNLTDIKPIRRLAIANRGEAAMRCIRAVKSLGALESSGIQVIALYTDVDRAALFVRHADVALRLPTKGSAV